MPDNIFEHPRLVSIYDALEPDRSDLDFYLTLAEQLKVRRVLDFGCGTGVFALLLAERGIAVTGIDPAKGSIDMARSKPRSGSVRWIHGAAQDLPAMQVDLATMTANVAQAIVDTSDWADTLRGIHGALRPGGRLAFETRKPAKRAWQQWNRTASYQVTDLPGIGPVQSWVELIEVNEPLVTFRWTWIFASDGQKLTSDSTLRFREREEIEADLAAHGYLLNAVREAPDRPDQEFIFIAERPT